MTISNAAAEHDVADSSQSGDLGHRSYGLGVEGVVVRIA
jgi:hypothetical protein